MIIPALNAEATLGATLAALAAQQGDVTFEVIVVDDGSRDGTAAVAAAASLPVRVLAGAGEGPAMARNLGAAAARGRVLAFTDADCVPAADWLAAALQVVRGADLVQGKVLPPPGVAVGPFDRHLAVHAEYGLYETANLVVDRALFDRLDGFESILRPRDGKELGEDVWLGWRARRAGARTAFASEAVVFHVVFPRSASGFVWERARLRFFPELARRVPELRDEFFFARIFLSRRSALFDAALFGAAVALVGRRAWPLALAAPYGRETWRVARRFRHDPARIAAVHVAADAVGLGALILGSARSRSPLL